MQENKIIFLAKQGCCDKVTVYTCHTRTKKRKSMSRAMLVVGTRPEGIKMMPVYQSLKQAGHDPYLCLTNQHDQLLTEVLNLFGVKADCQLQVMKPGQDLAHVNATVLERLTPVLQRIQPACVLVHGDTTTAMAAALASFYHKIPVVHVEAGLRTGDIQSPFPEELNRKIISQIADVHFAPTTTAVENLVAEGIKKSKIVMVGNTVVDALRITQEKIESGTIALCAQLEQLIKHAAVQQKKVMLFTMHRRESFGDALLQILMALKEYALTHPELIIIYPVHPNPVVQKAVQKAGLKKVETIYLTEPVAYKDLVYLLYHVDLIATDSGGIQEEAVSLGKQVIVLREKSERMEGVWAGFAMLVGFNPALFQQKIDQYLYKIPEQVELCEHIYGNGYAAQKIVHSLQQLNLLVSQNRVQGYGNQPLLQKG